MKRTTRKILLNLATGLAVAMSAALVFLPAAQAAPGVVTSNVNLRSGPGTNYAVVDVVQRGEQVDVQRCEGSFCYVAKPGPDGWISAQYLTAQGRPVNPGNPGVSFGFNVGGPGGPNVTIGIGNGNNDRPRPGLGFPGNGNGRPPFVRPAAEVCFFERTRFRGASECYREGESDNFGRRGGDFQSMSNEDGLSVQICGTRSTRDCRTYTTSASSLNMDIGSIRVR